MAQYVDSSAYLKLYVTEVDAVEAKQLLDEDRDWRSAAHTEVEVRRALSLVYRGRKLAEARRRFAADWASTTVVELDRSVCRTAALIAIATGIKTLDALHLAAAGPARPTTRLLTYDRKLAAAARRFGWAVAGAA